MRNQDHFRAPWDESESARAENFRNHDSSSTANGPADILELLERHAAELLRTHRRAASARQGDGDAVITDPWALMGANGAAGGNESGGGAAGAIQKLLALGEKIMTRMERSNPFEFLP